MVTQKSDEGHKRINMLFKADFFGERALLTEEPRWVLYNLAREIVQLSKDIESAVTLNSDSN